MAQQPAVVIFDVNETLSDMSPMASRFADIGSQPHLAMLWFASLLRDGFALTAAGSTEAFARLGEEALRVLLADQRLDRDLDAAVEHVMGGFMALSLHPDVPDGVRDLRESGLRLVTLSNGSTKVADELLTAGGIRDQFETLLSVEEAGAWKPAREAYEYAARACGTELADMTLVAAHPWDIDGAARAGLSTAWVNRAGARYPGYFTQPTYTVSTMQELAQRVAT